MPSPWLQRWPSLGLVELIALVACSMHVACGGTDDEDEDEASSTQPPAGCAPAERVVDGKCLAPGQQDNGCPAGTAAVEGGTCLPAGIPAELCAPGFEPDGAQGCRAILPAEPCGEGLLALPGETRCREISPCGAGTWGDIPVEASTQHVDRTYAGADSDGSTAAPWATIEDAVAAAEPGAIVAIAAGSYSEDLALGDKAVRLWGRCPGLVEIVGKGTQLGAVTILDAASDRVEVRDLAVRGTQLAFAISGSDNVLLDRVWVHDTPAPGIDAEDDLGATSFEITRSLIERNRTVAMLLIGASATIESTVVRDTRSDAGSQSFGCGIDLQDEPATGRRASALVRNSIVERNRYVGVLVGGSDFTMEGSIVRDTLEGAADSQFGRGIEVEDDPKSLERGSLTLRGSVVSGNRQIGVSVIGSDATIESTVVRDTLPGAALSGASTTLGGEGIAVWDNWDTLQRASLAITSSLVAGNHESGIVVGGSDATIDSTVVRDTQPAPDNGVFGAGLQIGVDLKTMAPASAAVRWSVIERSRYVGIQLFGASGVIEGTVVRGNDAQLSDGTYGDGIAVVQQHGSGLGTITASVVEGSVRAGISSFGAGITLSATRLECNSIQLDGEPTDSPFSFDDRGGNACGCANETVVCQVATSSLTPPEPPQSTQ